MVYVTNYAIVKILRQMAAVPILVDDCNHRRVILEGCHTVDRILLTPLGRFMSALALCTTLLVWASGTGATRETLMIETVGGSASMQRVDVIVRVIKVYPGISHATNGQHLPQGTELRTRTSGTEIADEVPKP
jgi:hypothetical protein